MVLVKLNKSVPPYPLAPEMWMDRISMCVLTAHESPISRKLLSDTPCPTTIYPTFCRGNCYENSPAHAWAHGKNKVGWGMQRQLMNCSSLIGWSISRETLSDTLFPANRFGGFYFEKRATKTVLQTPGLRKKQTIGWGKWGIISEGDGAFVFTGMYGRRRGQYQNSGSGAVRFGFFVLEFSIHRVAASDTNYVTLNQ